MKIIEREIWTLKEFRCQCCDGNGWLCFSRCPSCNFILLICDEVGTAFYNLEILNQIMDGGQIYFEGCCPNCKEAKLFDFVDAMKNQIRNLGFDDSELKLHPFA